MFDLLHWDGPYMRRPWSERRAALERLFAERALGPPWTLCPVTDDAATARRWVDDWGPFGIEGLMIKDPRSAYRPGVRGWRKWRIRHTSEALVGAVTGSVGRPRVVLVGRYDEAGRLRYLGRSVPLQLVEARRLAADLAPAGTGHPWEGRRFSAGWGSRELLEPVLVEPTVVAEVSADLARDASGRWRHPVRYARTRPDLAVEDVARFGLE